MFRMRRTGASKICIQRQTRVFDLACAFQHSLLSLLRKTEEFNDGLARRKSLECTCRGHEWTRPHLTSNVSCPPFGMSRGGKTMAREERRTVGGDMAFRSAHAPTTTKINWRAAVSSCKPFGLCPGTASTCYIGRRLSRVR